MMPSFAGLSPNASSTPTRDVDVDEVVCALLRAVRAFVDTMPSSAWRRSIDGVQRKLELEVARWAACPPSNEQRQAMLDLVADLETEVRGGVPSRLPPTR